MSGEIHALNAIFGTDGWSWALSPPDIVHLTTPHATRVTVRGTLTVHSGVETPSGFRFKRECQRDGIGTSTVGLENTNDKGGDGSLRACRAAVAGAMDNCINMFGIDMKTEMKIYSANHQEHKDSRSEGVQVPGQSASAPHSTAVSSTSSSRPSSALSASAPAPAVGAHAGPPLTPVTVTSGVVRRELPPSTAAPQYNAAAAAAAAAAATTLEVNTISDSTGEYVYNIAAPAISFTGGPLGTYQRLQPQPSSMYAPPDARADHGRTAAAAAAAHGHVAAAAAHGPGHGPGPGAEWNSLYYSAGVSILGPAAAASGSGSFTGTFKNEPPKMPQMSQSSQSLPDAFSAKRARP